MSVDIATDRSAGGGGVPGDFWPGLMLKLTVSEPVIRHSVVVLSSLHEYASPVHVDRDSSLASFLSGARPTSIDTVSLEDARSNNVCGGPDCRCTELSTRYLSLP